jgi:hypothetical protein
MPDPYPSHPPQFHHQNNILCGVKITKLLIQVSPVSCSFLQLTPNYLPHYPVPEHPQMTRATSTVTFHMLHFTFSRIHVKSTTALLNYTPPTKKKVLTHCKLCYKPLNCTITLSVKRINIHSETAIHCSHVPFSASVVNFFVSPKNYLIKQCIIISDVLLFKMSFHHSSHSRIVCPNLQYSWNDHF